MVAEEGTKAFAPEMAAAATRRAVFIFDIRVGRLDCERFRCSSKQQVLRSMMISSNQQTPKSVRQWVHGATSHSAAAAGSRAAAAAAACGSSCATCSQPCFRHLTFEKATFVTLPLREDIDNIATTNDKIDPSLRFESNNTALMCSTLTQSSSMVPQSNRFVLWKNKRRLPQK